MDDLSEKEQIEEIRKWWSEYGAWIMGGVVIAIAGVAGWNYNKTSQYEMQLAASDRYEELTELVADGKLVEAETIAGDIMSSYGDTVYASQTGIAMARLYMDKNRDQDAADSLRTVVESGKGDDIRHVARLRLARIYLYQDKAEEAIRLLESEQVPAFAAAYGEVIGDAYAVLGKIAEAETAYQGVLADEFARGTVDLTVVQWKLLDLPRAATVIDTEQADSGEPEASE